jgi:uncharacterized protein DUF6572
VAEPSSSPIGDPDTVDVVGVREDGGLDMVISASGPIDGSADTLMRLETKIRNYVAGATSELFLQRYGLARGAAVSIYVSCPYPIAGPATEVIEKLKGAAAKQGIALEVRKYMGEVH